MQCRSLLLVRAQVQAQVRVSLLLQQLAQLPQQALPQRGLQAEFLQQVQEERLPRQVQEYGQQRELHHLLFSQQLSLRELFSQQLS
jgi:hypothetical protein